MTRGVFTVAVESGRVGIVRRRWVDELGVRIAVGEVKALSDISGENYERATHLCTGAVRD
jgi:hypothetical protein